MAGTCKENGRGSDGKRDDGRKTVCRKMQEISKEMIDRYYCITRDMVKFIKAERIRWLGHVKRMEEGAMPRKMMEGRQFVGRRKGRPHLRWIDDVVADLKATKIKQWMEKMQDRDAD